MRRMFLESDSSQYGGNKKIVLTGGPGARYPPSLTLVPYHQPTTMAPEGFLCNQLTQEYSYKKGLIIVRSAQYVGKHNNKLLLHRMALRRSGEGKSSWRAAFKVQLVIYLVWRKKWPEIRIQKDFQVMANGLAAWSGAWKDQDWKSGNEDV